MPKKTGRPTSAEREVVVVRHMDTGESIAWSDGYFAGASKVLKHASREAYEAGTALLGGREASVPHNSRGAAVAMLSACSGRGRIISTDHGILPADDRII